MKPTLLILAAGMGSRFGGLKQVAPVGPNGETIIDYSIFDAIRAGFGKVVFIIRESFGEEFRSRFERMLKGKVETGYAFQELHMLPEGFSLPPGREKPWGTSHAILQARSVIMEPFAAINADDFYGFEAYKVLAGYLAKSDSGNEYAMVGYHLKNTLSDFGSVARGICEVGTGNYLRKIVETTQILKKNGGIVSIDTENREHPLTGEEPVSMNIWGFKPTIFPILEKKFNEFLKKEIGNLKSEMFIPSTVFDMISSGEAKVKVLDADSPWFGVTYREDQPIVVEKIRKLVLEGKYPSKLF